MSNHELVRRARPASRVLPALLVVTATLLASVALSLGSSASADTSGNPDTNTKAAFAPTAANLNPGATLAGAVEGSTVNIHVDGVAGKFFGVNIARLCRSGLNITTQSQLSPTSFGNCLAAPFVAGSDDEAVGPVSASPTNTSVDFTFRVGTGTEASHPGPGTPITCDATTPCSLWLWESVDTTIAPSGNIFKHYDVTYAGAPSAPGVAVVPGNGQLTVNLTPPASTGNAPITSYSVTVTGPGGSTQTGPGTSYTFSGLTNFTNYTVSATATNTAANGTTQFTSPAGTGAGTPVPSAPGAPTGVPGNNKVDLTWTAPSGPAPTSYEVVATPTNPAGPDITQTTTGTTYSFTGLTNGTVYTFKVRGIYGTTPGAYSASSAPITPNGVLITQTITVRRPQGALVLTQVCGAHDVVTTGTAPTFGGASDPLFSQYPYPSDANGDPIANYPTNCGINLGSARLITSGAGAGQFFEANGLLNQVTIVDTRDADPGFTVNGQMGAFTSTTGTFSGSQLGWTPVKTSDSPPFSDASGSTYNQTVAAGPAVAPNTVNGLGSGKVLGSAVPGQGLGIGVLDAGLKLWIPIFAKTGNYTGVLSITAV